MIHLRNKKKSWCYKSIDGKIVMGISGNFGDHTKPSNNCCNALPSNIPAPISDQGLNIVTLKKYFAWLDASISELTLHGFRLFLCSELRILLWKYCWMFTFRQLPLRNDTNICINICKSGSDKKRINSLIRGDYGPIIVFMVGVWWISTSTFNSSTQYASSTLFEKWYLTCGNCNPGFWRILGWKRQKRGK